ncbi:MAG: glycosyltransferase, partial [Planctomycetota bacterium]
ADQKGWDLIIPMLLHWAADRDVQWTILGTGEKKYENQLEELARVHPQRVGVKIAFSEALAHQIEAASDMFLMPSRYEPCGLNQLYSLKYGAVPIVNRTGGLADTVTDTNDATLADNVATGFVCEHYSVQALDQTLSRAVETYLHRKEIWAQIVSAGMSQDWSWESSAREYRMLYEQLVASPDHS